MKKYKFKLDALLKIRRLKEETCKMEIGRIQVQIRELEKQKQNHNDGIRDAFESQEVGLKTGLSGQEARFHPYYVEGKRAYIKYIEAKIDELEKRKEEKLEQLKFLRADVKVIEQMKEKDQKAYKKEIEKKQFAEIEEQVTNWKQTLGK